LEVFDLVRTLTFTSIGIVLFHVLAVLLGAHLFRSAELTARFAVLLSLMTLAPASVILKSDSSKWCLCILGRPRSKLEMLLVFSVLGAIVGSWLGAFVIPLDWERPWQVWPISCVVGAVIGHLIGCAVGIVLAIKLYSNDRTKLQ
jgi:phosphatidylinositol glycan class F